MVDTAAPVITIDAFAGDDVVNSDEQQVAQLLTGKATGAKAGDIVKVSIGDTELSGVVAADGAGVGVPAAILPRSHKDNKPPLFPLLMQQVIPGMLRTISR